ncbi:MAG TPA: MXAN_5187 C-terminal domain-containing protein [Polyangiaceae bacterium]|nr:MXAN_5187 C-terminal domain-containing protein [Polyangiaceae bacterium]
MNAGILVIVGLLTYTLLYTSLRDVLANPTERKRGLERGLRAAAAELALDAVRTERWLERQVRTESVRNVFDLGLRNTRADAATAEANRLRDAAVAEPALARLGPTLVLFVDEQGISIGRNGSGLMRGENIGSAYPSLARALAEGRGGSAVWINRERQEQMLVSYAPVLRDTGRVAGAVIIGTALSDERMTRTSELMSGQMLLFGVVGENVLDLVASSNNATSPLISAASREALARAARTASGSGATAHAETSVSPDYLIAAAPLTGYTGASAVLVGAVPVGIVGSVTDLLRPILGAIALGLVLVVAGGVLLGNYISEPISELEDGLLAIINGNSGLRFQIEHDELGGLVFRVNSLLNALMGVQEDTTDDQGRPSQGPRTQDFHDALSVDESAVSVSGKADPEAAAALAAEAAEAYYDRLFREYVAAKRRVGEPVDHITRESFRERIRESEEEMAARHGRPVRFQVELRNESVVLNAVPLP